MFTGIVQGVGKVILLERQPAHMRMTVDAASLDLSTTAIGDSIAVNGVCLTVTELQINAFSADLSPETLLRTTFSDVAKDALLNLELSVTPTTRLGGHMVSGHVDAVGEVIESAKCGEYLRLSIQVPAQLAKYIAEKGSVCINGVSLTVNEVSGALFEVMLIPHTLEATNLHVLEQGARVNIEVDMIARYVERLMQHKEPMVERGVTREFLIQHGYVKE